MFWEVVGKSEEKSKVSAETKESGKLKFYYSTNAKFENRNSKKNESREPILLKTEGSSSSLPCFNFKSALSKIVVEIS